MLVKVDIKYVMGEIQGKNVQFNDGRGWYLLVCATPRKL